MTLHSITFSIIMCSQIFYVVLYMAVFICKTGSVLIIIFSLLAIDYILKCGTAMARIGAIF